MQKFKMLVIGDVHWCQNSSIVRGMGNTFSSRLENLIQSINWAENIADNYDLIVYLGDFFDRDSLNSMEISALKNIIWSNKPHVIICGNHEMGLHNLAFNSADVFNLKNFHVVTSPESWEIFPNLKLYFLPYILENDRVSLEEYFLDFRNDVTKICFSHNDIKGIQMGQFLSQAGFEIPEIQEHFNLFVNGHLHNGSNITENIINLGNLSGQNFSEDASKYPHHIMEISWEDNIFNYHFLENPYAFNFYKLEIKNEQDLNILSNLKTHAVISAVCDDSLFDQVKELINDYPNITESRVIKQSNHIPCVLDNLEAPKLNSVDHLKEFETYITSQLGKSELIISELSEVIQ